MIVVTGGAGFIGSNIVARLKDRPDDIIVVDDLTDGRKFKNLLPCRIYDYIDKDDFVQKIVNGYEFKKPIKAIIHQGACNDTGETNGKFMMENNYEYSKILLNYSIANNIPFIYASSASVYGESTTFIENEQYEKPMNIYGYSKYQFDNYVRNVMPSAPNQIVGLRYFNVYGPKEAHKQSNASAAFHFYNKLQTGGKVDIFEGLYGYAKGEQRRDFIFVDDVASVNLWMLDHPRISGIFNVGTGRSQTLNQLANSIIDFVGKGGINYVPLPERLRGHYQCYTEADISKLRAAGYGKPFATVEQGIQKYCKWLQQP